MSRLFSCQESGKGRNERSTAAKNGEMRYTGYAQKQFSLHKKETKKPCADSAHGLR
jgi:hypothetical protein